MPVHNVMHVLHAIRSGQYVPSDSVAEPSRYEKRMDQTAVQPSFQRRHSFVVVMCGPRKCVGCNLGKNVCKLR